jgi:hypothetical protein
LGVSGANEVVDSKSMSPLDIPGLTDVTVKVYGKWQESNITKDSLKTAFRQAFDVMLENGLDLEQIYED